MKKKALLSVIIGSFLFIPFLKAQTWQATKRITWSSGYSGNAAIAVDTNNRLHVVWNDNTPGNSEIYYKKSTNGGSSWTTKRLTFGSGWSSEPAIATDKNDNIHVVWHEDAKTVEIFYKKSTNGGSSWTTKRLTWGSGNWYPDIATDGNNNIHVVWEGGHSGSFEIYHKKSTNGGETWTTKRLTWTSSSPGKAAIATDTNNSINIVWQDYTPGNYEIYLKRSTNGGVSWITKRLTWSSALSINPKIATDSNNHIHVIYEDDTPGNRELYYKKSTNGGVSWTTKRLTWSSAYSYSAAVATDSNNRIHVSYIEEVNGNTEIFYKRSTTGGSSWAHKRLTWNLGQSRWPAIAINTSNIIQLVYEDNLPGNMEIYHKKGIQ
jgi:hypothetical protein